MIQTPRSDQRSSDVGLYVALAALWIVPGLVFTVAAVLAGGQPHTRVLDWPYAAIRSVSQTHGQVLPWAWVGAATVRTPFLFWAVVVAVTAALVIGVALAMVVLRGGIPAVFPFLSQPVQRSRWAHRRALARAGLMTSGPTGRRLVVGRHRDGWVAVREGVSVLALGGEGSGKSAALCIPAIGEWEGSVVALSDRRDLVDAAAGLRQHRGRVDVLDLTGGTDLATVTWAPSDTRLTFDETEALVANVLGGRDPVPDELTQHVLVCVLYAAANRGAGVAGAVVWLDDESGEALVRSLLHVADRDPRATSWAHRILECDRHVRARCFSEARQLLRAHFEQASRGVTSQAFQPTEFLSAPANTLFIVTPTGGPPGGSVGSLLAALVAEAELRRPRRSLLVVLDGCAAVSSMPDVGHHLETRASSVTVLAAVRDLAECGAHAEWDMSVLTERARAIVVLGNRERDDEGRPIESPVPQVMHQLVRRQLAQRGGLWPRGRWDEGRPDLLPPDAARHLGQGRAVLVHERLAPAVVWLRNCYEDPDLLARFREHPYVRGVARIHQAS
jgi:Type IV secretory system Conjugative DNA transfer